VRGEMHGGISGFSVPQIEVQAHIASSQRGIGDMHGQED